MTAEQMRAEFAAGNAPQDTDYAARVYWRRVHGMFFAEEPAQAGLAFTEDMPVACEAFRKVWPEGGEKDA